jgi:hypothetical protein
MSVTLDSVAVPATTAAPALTLRPGASAMSR